MPIIDIRGWRVARQWKVLMVVSIGSFMAFLDAPVVSVAFPAIGESFPGTEATTLAWVLDAYFVGFAAFLVVGGKLADRFGRRKVFLAGMWLFTFASLACAIAPSAGFLIGARVAQALAAAIVVPAGQGLMLIEFPAEQRKVAIGVLAAIVGLATAAAPTIGALIVDGLGWRWVFYLNVFVGVAAIAYAMGLLHRDRGTPEARMPDPVGAVLQAAALSFLVLGILKSADWGLGDVRTLGCFAVAALALPLFVQRCRTHAAPVIDLTLFRNRNFAVANFASLVFALGFYAMTINSVLYFDTIWEWAILTIGLSFIPGSLVGALAGGPAGQIAEKRGARIVTIVGALMCGVGLAMIAIGVGTEPNYWTGFFPGQVIWGIGIVAGLAGLVGAALTSAPEEQYAVASGINSAFRQVGGAIGVALVVAVLSDATPANLADAGHVGWWIGSAASFATAAAALLMRRSMQGSPGRDDAAPAAAPATVEAQ